MKKSIKLLASISTAAIIVFTSTGSVFADREMIIPGLPKVEYRNGYGAYEGVVAHSTATPEAPAINIRNYEARTWRSAFVHYATDWDETIQIASTKYQAWGAGPAANKRFVHVELSETSDPTKFKKSYERYVKLLAKILRDRNINPSIGLWTHKDITYKLGGTDHEDPIDYLRSHGVSESKFRADVLKAYNGDSISVKPKPQQPNEVPGVINEVGVAYIDGYNVNLRSGPSTTNSVIRKLQKGESYKVWGKVGNWLNLGGNQWVYNDSSYIRYKEESSSAEGKRVVSKLNDLRFYSKASWADRDVAGTVDEGLGFTIINKVSVDGSPQYKVKNSRGSVFYITASSYYVEIK
ncbi:N-acetylmuramoyl-L-alanine amidase [Bacillus thuringiensis]|uniref:N-acetylmuramoyl-L-alanine amidase n=1 Tax=Bacillus thuringiensis TaxID=1428 RepID=UPI0007C1996A|nr:N-acetylmuramoyl-L-alanine amidase [Bacillus thuringiensis]AND10370.1 N-acetylmuramoyl-L-alanine amidase [Bacillus thuringiensis serovar alesti]MEC3599828.1 N-acetylmuramoyl-L-alanine amidase [Bacillus thuringiensis]MED1837962.1 N-acetylmuramoyl-L-alanine amidase [Bacillus thuringiensis]MED2211018.1 N-acetylmuramoyl-L-alanine amidase [Bacillus thuringiensis]MED2666616.1 N-acetylmuramoyl-L-alanine amidase [Bacillus thuringiensis]